MDSMSKYKCCECQKILNTPFECANCGSNFCKIHLKQSKICPNCKQSSNRCHANLWLINTINNFNICSLCNKFRGEDYDFGLHLINNHLGEVIDHFKTKSTKNVQKAPIIAKVKGISKQKNIGNTSNTLNNSNIIDNKTKEIKKSQKPNLVINTGQNDPKTRTKEIKIQYSEVYNTEKKNPEVKNIEIQLPFQKREPFKKFNSHEIIKPIDSHFLLLINSLSPNPEVDLKIKNLEHCNKMNEKIICDCCADHMCKEGNCLCVNCMKINVEKNKLEKGILINRKGYCSAYNKDKKEFYCNQQYKSKLKSDKGAEFNVRSYCGQKNGSCDDCKVLNKFIKEYIEEVYPV